MAHDQGARRPALALALLLLFTIADAEAASGAGLGAETAAASPSAAPLPLAPTASADFVVFEVAEGASGEVTAVAPGAAAAAARVSCRFSFFAEAPGEDEEHAAGEAGRRARQ